MRSYSETGRHSLLAEVAFLLAKNNTDGGRLTRFKIEEDARKFVTRLPRSELSKTPLTKEEWAEVDKLSGRIEQYLNGKIGVQFSPTIPGCGVVDITFADIQCASELIEVKAVTRPFRSMDYRQIVTYIAMLHAAGHQINTATLLNPRRSRYVSINIEDLAATASGKSKVEVMHDITTWMIGLQVSA
ncbi:hypothetical protein [Nocardia jinanensis]|uniref:hypothetical protein n=1 Tax=Nocardia jinanensis TaxID=382504 RepID=UPI0012E3A1C4|nr:hypothetical protein [Nocardia jinanensis]